MCIILLSKRYAKGQHEKRRGMVFLRLGGAVTYEAEDVCVRGGAEHVLPFASVWQEKITWLRKELLVRYGGKENTSEGPGTLVTGAMLIIGLHLIDELTNEIQSRFAVVIG